MKSLRKDGKEVVDSWSTMGVNASALPFLTSVCECFLCEGEKNEKREYGGDMKAKNLRWGLE